MVGYIWTEKSEFPSSQSENLQGMPPESKMAAPRINKSVSCSNMLFINTCVSLNQS